MKYMKKVKKQTVRKKQQKKNKSAQKIGKCINWNVFNFLENLIHCCAMTSRNVPKESGVHFQISSQVKDEAICILFHIDRQDDPLISDKDIKPDYLCIYLSPSECIFTIIELKGTEKKNLAHGIDQIVSLKNKLKDEIKTFLPSKFKPRFQGILLTPFNSDIPRKKIAETNRNGFPILPVQYNHKAELYDYITKLNGITELYKHNKSLPHDKNEFNFIEQILVYHTLSTRKQNDRFYQTLFNLDSHRTHLFLDFKSPICNDYGVFYSDKSKILFASNQNLLDEIKKSLVDNGFVAPSRKIPNWICLSEF